jgi:hypothetical protein
MRTISILLFPLVFSVSSALAQNPIDQHKHDTVVKPTIDSLKKSIPKQAHIEVGYAHLYIDYYAPAVRNRTIWGGLVPYDEVWVTGAHNATSFEFTNTIIIGDKEIPPGKYALFTIPGREKWIVILNKNWNQHLADDYKQEEDVVRVEVIPMVHEKLQERLRYSIHSADDSSASIEIRWEKLSVTLPFQVR